MACGVDTTLGITVSDYHSTGIRCAWPGVAPGVSEVVRKTAVITEKHKRRYVDVATLQETQLADWHTEGE